MFVLVACLVHMVRPDFNKDYKRSLMQGRHSLVTYLPVEAERCEGTRRGDI